MNTKIHTVSMIGALLAGGCSLPMDSDDLDFDALDEISEPDTTPALDPADELAHDPQAPETHAGMPIIDPECIGAPVVGVLNSTESSCELPAEAAPNWQWVEMFSTLTPQVAGLTLPVPAELQRFCMYEYIGGGPLLDDGQYNEILQAIDNHPDMDLGSVAVDCMGFRGQGDLNDASVVDALHESFMMNIDRPEDLDLAPTEAQRRPTKLYVLDSVSQEAIDGGLVPHNEHGLQISRLAEDISCTPGVVDCLDQVENMLAMPREDYVLPDWTIGKDYGSKIDMAVQIYAAVQKWRENKMFGGGDDADRAIISLALGYQRFNLGSDDRNRGPHRALHTALKFAACQGVPVFAASGNVSDEDCPNNETGPLSPAIFNNDSAPTMGECEALDFLPDQEWAHEFPVFEPEEARRPLVYAVHGVDAQDVYLGNGLEGGRSPLAALGFAGVASGESMPLTGSSVAVTVASAVAHMAWSYNPYLTPGQLYDAIYSSGYDLGVGSDYGPSGTSMRIRRLSVGAALESACAGLSPAVCPQLGSIAQPPAADGNLGGFFSATEAILADPGTKQQDFEASIDAPVCEDPIQAELVLPQPEAPICANCSGQIKTGLTPNDDEAHLTIDSAYKGQITAATLLTEGMLGDVDAFPLDWDVINAINDPLIDVVTVYFDAPNAQSATMSFTLLLPGETQSNPIPLRIVE